jgi:uncharacterized protein
MITRLYMMPTHACNGACSYCYLPDETMGKRADSNMFRQALDNFISQMLSAKVDEAQAQLRFIGGEPYVAADLMTELALKFLGATKHAEVTINTNGTMITPAKLAPLAAYSRRVVHIVSLDGPKAIHDARRPLKNGGSSFDAGMEGIKLLQSLGFPVYTNMVLDQESAETMPELLDLLQGELGINSISVSLLHQPSAPTSPKESLALLEQAYEMATARGVEVGGHHRLLLGALNPGFKCQAGHKTALLTAEGELIACQRFVGHDKGIHLGADINFASQDLGCGSSHQCYDPRATQLAEGLMDLYSSRFPRYMEPHKLDRILFGGLFKG